MKKLALNLLLVVAIAGLAYISVRSILDPIEFTEEREHGNNNAGYDRLAESYDRRFPEGNEIFIFHFCLFFV